MMKFTIVLVAVLAVSSAQFNNQLLRYPTRPPPPAPRPSAIPNVNRVATNDQTADIESYESDINPDGSFRYSFRTTNGISAEAQGTPRNLGGNPPNIPVAIAGSFSHYSPEGQLVSITYIADENGYQPQGDSIPTPPPIPEHILRALDYIARNPQQQK